MIKVLKFKKVAVSFYLKKKKKEKLFRNFYKIFPNY